MDTKNKDKHEFYFLKRHSTRDIFRWINGMRSVAFLKKKILKNISTTCSIALFPRLLGIKLWGKAWWMWRCGGGSVWWSEALMLLLPCSIPLGFFSYSLSRFLLLLKESWASSSLKQNLKTEEEYQGIQRPGHHSRQKKKKKSRSSEWE